MSVARKQARKEPRNAFLPARARLLEALLLTPGIRSDDAVNLVADKKKKAIGDSEAVRELKSVHLQWKRERYAEDLMGALLDLPLLGQL